VKPSGLGNAASTDRELKAVFLLSGNLLLYGQTTHKAQESSVCYILLDNAKTPDTCCIEGFPVVAYLGAV